MLEHQNLYNTAKWKRYRVKHLTQQPRCVMCLAMNRHTPATEVDHIIPHCGDSVLFWDTNNYQSLCNSCHSQKTYYETRKSNLLPRTIKPKSKDITLLFGPPCSGKSTYAKTLDAKVVDFDVIKQTLSGQDPFDMDDKYLSACFAVRNRLIENTKGKLIVIGTLANRKARQDWLTKLDAKALMMITHEHECIRRLKKSSRPNKPGQIALIRKWFNDFTPLGNESFAR